MISQTNIVRALQEAGKEISNTVTVATNGVNNAIRGAIAFLTPLNLHDASNQNDHELTKTETHQLVLATKHKIPRELVEQILKYSMQITRTKSDAKQKGNQEDFVNSFFKNVGISIRLVTEEGTAISPHIRAFLEEAQGFTSDRPVTPKLQADLDALAKALDNDDDDAECRFSLLELRRTMLITKEELPENFRFTSHWIQIGGANESGLLDHERQRNDRI